MALTLSERDFAILKSAANENYALRESLKELVEAFDHRAEMPAREVKERFERAKLLVKESKCETLP